MTLATDLAAMKVDVAYIKDRLAQIDRRLEAGDKRFHNADVQEAAETARVQLATKLGLVLLGGAGTVGAWGLSYVPALVRWWLSTRG